MADSIGFVSARATGPLDPRQQRWLPRRNAVQRVKISAQCQHDARNETSPIAGAGAGDPDPGDELWPSIVRAAREENLPVGIDVLANDSDPDGDLLAITAVTQGANGKVIITFDKRVIYAPAFNFVGADSFTYSISDGRGGTASATVALI